MQIVYIIKSDIYGHNGWRYTFTPHDNNMIWTYVKNKPIKRKEHFQQLRAYIMSVEL